MNGAHICRDNIVYRDNGHFKRAVWLSRDDAVIQRHRGKACMNGQNEKKIRISPHEQWEALNGLSPKAVARAAGSRELCVIWLQKLPPSPDQGRQVWELVSLPTTQYTLHTLSSTVGTIWQKGQRVLSCSMLSF